MTLSTYEENELLEEYPEILPPQDILASFEGINVAGGCKIGLKNSLCIF